MKDDLADYGEFDGGYAQDYEDFMWPRLHPLLAFADCWTTHFNSMTLPHSQAHYQNHARKLWTPSHATHTLPSKRFMQRISSLRYFSLVCELRSMFVGIINPIKRGPSLKCESAVSINHHGPGNKECYCSVTSIFLGNKWHSMQISVRIDLSLDLLWLVSFCKLGQLTQPVQPEVVIW